MTTAKSVVDVLKYFTQSTWNTFASTFPDIQNHVANGSLTVADTINKISRINNFLGFNIANPPGFSITPALLIPILAGLLQFIQGKQLQVTNKDANKDNPAASAMNSMNVVMPLMSVFFCITFPIGVGIYWIATSVFAIIQQYFVNKYMDRVDVDELIAKNVAKASKRNKYLESKGISMSELAKKQTKYIDSSVTEKGKTAEKIQSDENEPEEENNTTQKTQSSAGPKSISDIANLLRNRNEKGDK
jgi:YidC/Oxa1 family membrane protein insertase